MTKSMATIRRRERCSDTAGPMPAAVFVLTFLATGCAFDGLRAEPPTPSAGPVFREQVYPQVLRDCGFPDCHGAPGRFFRVYGPGRTRITTEGVDAEGNPIDMETLTPRAPATEEEITATWERARSMLGGAGRAEDTLLVRKPLVVERGGAAHMGIDAHGRDVYATPDEEGYQLLLRWARTGFSE